MEEQSRPESEWEITVLAVYEQKFVVKGRNATEAEIAFRKKVDTGEFQIKGVIQSSRTHKLEDHEIDEAVYKIERIIFPEGQADRYTVTHRATGLQYTDINLKKALSKLDSDLARRKLSIAHHED